MRAGWRISDSEVHKKVAAGPYLAGSTSILSQVGGCSLVLADTTSWRSNPAVCHQQQASTLSHTHNPWVHESLGSPRVRFNDNKTSQACQAIRLRISRLHETVVMVSASGTHKEVTKIDQMPASWFVTTVFLGCTRCRPYHMLLHEYCLPRFVLSVLKHVQIPWDEFFTMRCAPRCCTMSYALVQAPQEIWWLMSFDDWAVSVFEVSGTDSDFYWETKFC